MALGSLGRCAPCGARLREESGLHRDCHRLDRLWHRCERRHLQPRRSAAHQAAAGASTERARHRRLARQTRHRHAQRRVVPGLCGHPRADHELQRATRAHLRNGRLQHRGGDVSAREVRHHGEWRLLPHARRRAGDRSRLPAGGGSRRRSRRRDRAQPRDLAAGVRRRPVDRRAHGPDRRHRVHRRRRGARVVHRPSPVRPRSGVRAAGDVAAA